MNRTEFSKYLDYKVFKKKYQSRVASMSQTGMFEGKIINDIRATIKSTTTLCEGRDKNASIVSDHYAMLLCY